MPTYATATDVQAYLGKTPPSDVDRLIERASELVDYLTLGKINTENAEHVEAAKKAVCAQIEYWMWLGESQSETGISAYSVGDFSIDFANGRAAGVAPRTMQYLWLAGLINRGVTRV